VQPLLRGRAGHLHDSFIVVEVTHPGRFLLVTFLARARKVTRLQGETKIPQEPRRPSRAQARQTKFSATDFSARKPARAHPTQPPTIPPSKSSAATHPAHPAPFHPSPPAPPPRQ